MPRRRVLTDEQLRELLALPVTEALLIQHWTLSPADLAIVERRRGDPNQLGFALQLCAFRYPGRLLWSDEAIPVLALRFVADQLGVAPGALPAYGTRPQTRREQLDALRASFGFAMFAPEHQREFLTWLLPVALGTADTMAVAKALMGELRRRKILTPGPSVIERLVAAAPLLAERQVARQLTRGLLPVQAKALDELLTIKEGTTMSALAWARQPPGVPGHRTLARLIEQRAILCAIALDPAGVEGVHPERLRKLAREGARFTAQHLRTLSPLRRRAILVATVLDTITRLTDDTVTLFDRAVGRMFRRAETRERHALLRDTREINDKVRLLARLGTALIEARENGADFQEAVASAIGWDKLARSVEEAQRLARPDKTDLPAWNDALRFATSVRTGAASASLLLKRLGAYPRQNGLALALREIGRIERTLFMLDWIERPGLRHQTTAELNKGEARNALVRAICFHRLGRLRDRTIEAQQYRASGLALVTAAIALWNTVYLGRAIDALRRGGEMIPDALLAHLAPGGWQHINLTGDYLWDSDISLCCDGFRPLRSAARNLSPTVAA
jgi:TnpA family transposase